MYTNYYPCANGNHSPTFLGTCQVPEADGWVWGPGGGRPPDTAQRYPPSQLGGQWGVSGGGLGGAVHAVSSVGVMPD